MNAPVKKVNRLSAKEMFKLTEFVREHYAASGLYDTDFAPKASEALGFIVSESSVQTARETLELPSNRDVERARKAAPTDTGELAERIDCLTRNLDLAMARIAKLEANQRILINFAQKAGPVAELSGLQFRIGGKANGS